MKFESTNLSNNFRAATSHFLRERITLGNHKKPDGIARVKTTKYASRPKTKMKTVYKFKAKYSGFTGLFKGTHNSFKMNRYVPSAGYSLGKKTAASSLESGFKPMSVYFLIKKPMKRLLHSVGAECIHDLLVGLRSNFHGVYSDFEEARAAIPKSRKIGYNHAEAARMYRWQLQTLLPSDYATIYWLERLLKENRKLFDLGGNVGLLFYSFRRYLSYPGDLRWLVCDLPQIIIEGKKVVKEDTAEQLSFTSDYSAAEDHDVYLASGCLQYIETPIDELIAKLTVKPKHLVINRVPLHDERSFVTLQDIGPVLCPYKVFHKSIFISSLNNIGYEVVDSWSCSELSCRVPIHPHITVGAYQGMYLKFSE